VGWTIEHVEEAPVSPDAVFALYADPRTWSEWGHSARWAEADGPMEEGGYVRVKAAYGAVYRCRVLRLVPGRALSIEVRPVGLRIVNHYEVEPMGDGARIRHAFDVGGPISGPSRILAGAYWRQLQAEVRAVAARAARSAAPAAP
jgi:hypothetical protein